MMKKRGVSPLIASVLLIAFVILLFVLITTWVRRSAIEPSMGIAEEKLAGVLECINVKIDIVEACVDSDGKLFLKVDNMGDTDLEGVKVRVFGKGGSGIGKIVRNAAPFQRIDGGTGISITDYAQVDRVEVYPIIKGESICEGEMDSVISIESTC